MSLGMTGTMPAIVERVGAAGVSVAMALLSGEPGLAKPFASGGQKFGLAVELPDVYIDTAGVAAAELAAGRAGGKCRRRFGPPDAAVREILAAPQGLFGAGAIRWHDAARLVRDGQRLVVAEAGGLLAVRAPAARLEAGGPAREALCRYALRTNADLRLVRWRLAGDHVELCAFLPASGFRDREALRSGLVCAVDAVATASSRLPPAATIADGAFLPLLLLASGASPHPITTS